MTGMSQEAVNNIFRNAICKPKKKPRTNWRKEIKLERNRVLDEAILLLRRELREVPEAYKRGYNSAITKLEIMKDDAL